MFLLLPGIPSKNAANFNKAGRLRQPALTARHAGIAILYNGPAKRFFVKCWGEFQIIHHSWT